MGIIKLPEQWRWCIDVQAEYVEKLVLYSVKRIINNKGHKMKSGLYLNPLVLKIWIEEILEASRKEANYSQTSLGISN